MSEEECDDREIVEEWTKYGHRCRIVKVSFNEGLGHSHYCGYVQTGLRFHYEDAMFFIDVHGGLTYGVDKNGWVGFDFAHAGDLCINKNGEIMSRDSPIKIENRWTIESVEEEVNELAYQLKKLEEFVESLS